MPNSNKDGHEFILVDTPAPFVRRITLNRPEKRNAMTNALRGEVFDTLAAADLDDSVRVTIIRGAGKCFCAGYDIGGDRGDPTYQTSGGMAYWPRHVVEGWFRVWDLAKPVIAQVHGYCLAGGTELATSCDLVYVADDAEIGYPVTRRFGSPDMQYHPWLMGMRNAMEAMLTGDAMTGIEAVEKGFANRAYPLAELDERVLERAERVAKTPTDLQQMNKRLVHHAMDIMGMRSAMRSGTELQALSMLTETSKGFQADLQKSVTGALQKRDEAFGDYRTKEKHDSDE
ncbi:MAG: enoyl-CoA hydratase-related protein [Proteobacteria bacterium]|jgi:enoyl-CoA hydratase|nr:enoyl-CoA hydratase-related protein [Pseudomonadota bacterium]